MASLMAVLVFYKFIPNTFRDRIIWLSLSTFVILGCIAILVTAYKVRLISDLNITNRKERPLIFGLFLVLGILMTITTYLIGYIDAANLLVFGMVSFLVAVIITLFWKISIHTFLITLTWISVYDTFENALLLPLFILPVIIAWTRVHLKKHTLNQVIGGIAVAVLIYMFWKFVFPYNIFNLRPNIH